MPKEEQINTKSSAAPEKSDEAKKADAEHKDDTGVPLTEQDIKLFKRYGKGPYNDALKKVEDEVKGLNQKITELIGIKESDTGLALQPSGIWLKTNKCSKNHVSWSVVSPKLSTQALQRPNIL